MAKECADDQESDLRTCKCGWHIPVKDTAYIESEDVVHVICYQCGEEWVE
jgi:hypothetical protein